MNSGGESKSTRADIVVVGGGPATLGLLTNALKQNRLHELVATGDGLAIIEQGMSLGGGELQNFGLNSNTSARGFLKCAYKKREVVTTNADNGEGSNNKNSNKKASGEKASPPPKKKKQTDGEQDEESDDELAEDSERGDGSDDEPVSPQKQWQTVPLNCFKDFYQLAPIYKTMAEYGSLIVPLSVVGMYLNYCGNHLLHYVYTVMRRRIFYPCHRVTSIQLLQSGEILTHAVKRIFSLKANEKEGTVTFGTESTQVVTFRSKAIVVSNGGRQALPPAFFKEWFPFMKEKKDRVLLSDVFSKKDVYKATMSMIKEKKLKNIVIVGASHSGFSSAWLLLHGPATWKRNNALVRQGKTITRAHLPEAPLKSNPHCGECCSCSEAKKTKNPKCDCLCKCWGYFKHQDWDFDHDTDLATHFEEGSIKILYREKIRVFYGTVKQAKADGYTDFNDHIFSNPNGFVYSYTGLRGDAKWLYRQVKQGHEKRVAFVLAATPALQAEHIRNADLVIWACGYHTNKIPIKDHEGKEISLSQRVALTQYDVDGKCRICVSDGSLLTKAFGTGLAYPTRTNDGMMRPDAGKPDPRADSFSLYCGWVANRILLNLLPKTVIESKLHRTMRNNRKKAIESNLNNNNNQQNASTKKGGKNEGGGNTGQNQSQQTPAKTKTYKKVESVVKKQLKQAVLDEAARQEEKAKQRSPRPSSKSKATGASPMCAKDEADGSPSPALANDGTAKPQEIKEASEKTGSHGGYMRGTLASDNRAKLIKGNNQESEDQESFQQERAAPASQAASVFIPPQITQSQQQYIQRRKEAIEKELAEQQQLMDKHKPLPPQQRNHAAVQSRYLKQAAPATASAAKKVETTNKATAHTPVQVKKSQTAHTAKPKTKEKAKGINSQASQSALDQLSIGKATKHLEKSSSKKNFMTAEKTVNNYMHEELLQQAPSPEAAKRVASPPTGSADNTWSASTEVDRVAKSRTDGAHHKSTPDEARKSTEQIRMRAILQGQEVDEAPNEGARADGRATSPRGFNDIEGEIVHEKVAKNVEQVENRSEEASCYAYLDEAKIANCDTSKKQVAHVNYTLQGAAVIEDDTEAQQVAKLSQNYMTQQNLERQERHGAEYPGPQKVSRLLNQHRQSNSQTRTHQGKKSAQLQIHNNLENSGSLQMGQHPNSTCQRPYSKNEYDRGTRNAALQEYQNLKKAVLDQAESRAKNTSPKAAGNFQTAEPVVSRAQKMQECFEQVDIANSGRKNQQKAHSPEFYSSKVNFTQAPGANGQLTDSKVAHHNTQKLSSLFNRHANDGNQASLQHSQSSKGLSFNQYLLWQQQQALQLQNPLLRQGPQPQQARQMNAHRPSKSQWSTTPEATNVGSAVPMHPQVQYLHPINQNVVLQQNGARIASGTNVQHRQKQAPMIAQYSNFPQGGPFLPHFIQSDQPKPQQNAALGLGMKAQQVIIPHKASLAPFQPILAAPQPIAPNSSATLKSNLPPDGVKAPRYSYQLAGGDQSAGGQGKKTIFIQNTPHTVKPHMPMKVFQIPGLAGQTAKNMMSHPNSAIGTANTQQNAKFALSEKKPVQQQVSMIHPPYQQVKGNFAGVVPGSNPLQNAGAQNVSAMMNNPGDLTFSQSMENSFYRVSQNQNATKANIRQAQHTQETGSSQVSLQKGANAEEKKASLTEIDHAGKVEKRHSQTLKHSSAKFAQSLSEMQQSGTKPPSRKSNQARRADASGQKIKVDSGEVKIVSPLAVLPHQSPAKIQKPLPQFVGDQRALGAIVEPQHMSSASGRLTNKQANLPTMPVMITGASSQMPFVPQNMHQKAQQQNVLPHMMNEVLQGRQLSTNNFGPGQPMMPQGNPAAKKQAPATIMMNVNLNSPKQIVIQKKSMQVASMFQHQQQQSQRVGH